MFEDEEHSSIYFDYDKAIATQRIEMSRNTTKYYAKIEKIKIKKDSLAFVFIGIGLIIIAIFCVVKKKKIK